MRRDVTSGVHSFCGLGYFSTCINENIHCFGRVLAISFYRLFTTMRTSLEDRTVYFQAALRTRRSDLREARYKVNTAVSLL